MTMATQAPQTGAHIISELGTMSRDNVVFTSGLKFVAGEVFAIVSGKAVKLAPTASDGSQTPAGVTYAAVDATGGDTTAAATTRLTEVIGEAITWPAAITTAQKTTAIAALKAINILVR